MSAQVEATLEAVAASPLPPAQRREGLSTLSKLLRNLLNSPHEEKYRRIRTTNPAIAERLFPECFDLLKATGFEERGEFLQFLGTPGSSVVEALEVVDSLVLSLGPAEAAPKTSAAERPAAKAKSSQQMKQERARAAAEASQADSQAQLAALRRQRAERYQEQQDTALAYHLSGHDAEAPYDPISALNQSRGAVYSFVTCNMCGTPLRYNSATSAQAVLCPCGNLLQPIHLQGQVFRRRAPSELPVEPGEPVDPNSRPRAVRGPYIQVTGPDGAPSRMPLYSVLQMVRQHGETQQVGADGRTIQALPTRKFAGGEAAAADGTRCEICMEDFAEGDELRTLPCFHLFHSKCIDQWLQVNSICPICRHKVGS